MPKVPRLSTRIALGWARRQARRFPPQPLEPLPADTTARILVVNTTGIGDTIFCTAPIADLRESFPKARIDLFVDRRRVELVENNPHLSDIVVYPGKFKRVRATIRELREKKYDVAIIQHLLVEKICVPALNSGKEIKWAFPHSMPEVLEIGSGRETGAGGGAGFAQLAVIVRPTPLAAVRDVSKANELMPQKSTFFYPKLATGLFLNPLA